MKWLTSWWWTELIGHNGSKSSWWIVNKMQLYDKNGLLNKYCITMMTYDYLSLWFFYWLVVWFLESCMRCWGTTQIELKWAIALTEWINDRLYNLQEEARIRIFTQIVRVKDVSLEEFGELDYNKWRVKDYIWLCRGRLFRMW